jgi:hypothetical protein
MDIINNKEMNNIKEKFKGYSIAAWVILIGGIVVFAYGVKEVVLESYETWTIPAGAVVFGIIIMRYPSLLANLFKKKTGLEE